MGTIAQKLEYLNDTRLLLKDNINKINNVLDDNSTFRSYPQELFNGYLDILNNGTDTLWSNLEKVSQSGTEAVLEGVETAPMKVELQGNTSQETTSGKNLLGLTNGTYSHNGITAVVNDGTITITGTATANSFVNIPLIKDIVLSNEQVTVSINNATTISDTATEFRVYESGTNYIPVQFTTIDRKTTITKTGTFVSAYVRTTSGVNYGSGLVIKPQLELGSTATSWEKYTNGASPNPDYPQEVKVVKGENVVSVSGKNLFDGILELGNINSTTGEKMVDSNYIINTNPIPVEELTNYKISSNGEGIKMYIFEYKEDLSYNLTNRKSVDTNAYFTTNSGTRYISFRPVSSITNLQEPIQIERGTTATPYVPYSKTDYPIDLVAENIFDKDDARILRGYINNSNKAIYTSNNDYSVIVKVKPSTKYIVTKMANNPEKQAKFRLGTTTNYPQMGGARDNVCNQVISDDTATELSITTESNDNYLVIFCYNLNSTTTLNEMLGSLVVREAEPIYKEMCEEDYFYKQNDKWYIHKGFGKVTDESGSTSITISDMVSDAKVYSYYGGTVSGNTITYDEAISDTNYIYYPLQTPIEKEITNTTLIKQLEAIYKAKSVKDKTYITQTNEELPFILDVSAIKEYEVV